MSDLTGTIQAKSDQLNADDLIGRTMTITVTKVDVNPAAEQPVTVHFEGDRGKPYKPSKGMRRVLVHVWGARSDTYVGRSLTLYRDPAVRYGSLDVGGIRISHMSHIEEPVRMALTERKGSKKPHEVHPLQAAAPGPEPRKDEAAEFARGLVERIRKAGSTRDLERITSEPAVMDGRARLMEERPKLAARITEEVTAALARIEEQDAPDAAEDSAA